MPTPTAPLRSRILALVIEVLGCRPDVTAETTLKALQVHPMRRMELVCEVEEHFGLTLTISAFDAAKTIGDLLGTVEQAVAEQTPHAA